MSADRDAHGRFLPGRPGGPGRPRRVIQAGQLAAPSETVTPEVRHDFIATAFDQGRNGDRFPAVSQRTGPCDVSTQNGPPVRLDPDPAATPKASADEPSSGPAEGESGLETVASDPPAGSLAPVVARPPVLAEWQGAPLDGHWHTVLARVPVAWKNRWAERAELLQAAGLPRVLAEFRAYREVVEEIAV
jgi:hypothetical protein